MFLSKLHWAREWEKATGVIIQLIAAGLLTKDCSHSWTYIEALNQPPGLLWVGHWTQLYPAYAQTFRDSCLYPIKSSKYFFLSDCVPNIELPPFHLSHGLLPVANVNCFQRIYIFLPQNIMSKSTWQLQAGGHTCLSLPPSHAAGGFDSIPWDPVLLQLAFGSTKPFFKKAFGSESFTRVNFKCSWVYSDLSHMHYKLYSPN